MHTKRLLGLFIMISSLVLLTSCNSPQLIQTLTQTPPGISKNETVLTDSPTLQVTIPYDNPAPCLDDIGSVLASFHTP